MEGRISKVGNRGILSAVKRVFLAGRGRGVSVYCVEKSDFGDKRVLESIVQQAMSMLDKFVLDPFCSVEETPTCIWIRLPLDYLLSLFRQSINRVEAKFVLNFKHRATLSVYTNTSLTKKDEKRIENEYNNNK